MRVENCQRQTELFFRHNASLRQPPSSVRESPETVIRTTCFGFRIGGLTFRIKRADQYLWPLSSIALRGAGKDRLYIGKA